MPIGQEAIMPDTMEAVRQAMKQEAADELERVERHQLRLVVMAIVLPAKADTAIGKFNDTGIGDGDTVRVAAKIGQHLLRPAKRRLGIDNPLRATNICNEASEGCQFRQSGEGTEELELTSVEGSLQSLKKQPPKQP